MPASPSPRRARSPVSLVCAAAAAWATAGGTTFGAATGRDLPEHLAQHPALAARHFVAYPCGPFVLHVEHGDAAVAAFVMPALEALVREVAAAVEDGEVGPESAPIALVLCSDPLTPRWVRLASGASFEGAAASDYEPRLRAVVQHWDVARSTHAPDDTLRPLLRDACAALLATRAGRAPASPWLARGLAVHLAERALGQPWESTAWRVSATLPIETRRLVEVRTLLADLPRRLAWWDTLPAVLAAESIEAYPALHADAKGWPDTYPNDAEAARVSFELQAALFVAYLYDGARSGVVARMPAFAAACLTEHVDALGLLERLEIEEFAALEGGAEVWLDLVFAQRADLAPAAVLSPDATLPEPEALARGRRAGLAAHFDRTRLLPGPASFDELAAEALWLGSVGRVADAACVLELAAARVTDDEARGYLVRERARMLDLGAARAAWLQHALTGGRVRLPIGGHFVEARVAALEGAALRLATPIDGQSYVPLAALDARVLGRNLARADTRGVTPAWVGGYALLLAGERGWRDVVRGELEGRSLPLDALVIEALRGRALARGRVLALAASPYPEDDAEVERVLTVIGALVSEADRGTEGAARSACDAPQLSLLRDLAQRCLERRHATADVHALLVGRSEALEADVVRLTYDFDDKHQLDDFIVDLAPPELPPSTGRTQHGHWFVKPSPATKKDSELALTGRVELRHRVELAPPCRLLVELRDPEYAGGAALAESHTIVFAMLDGGEGGPTVRSVDRAGFVVRQGPVNQVDEPDQAPFPSGAERTVELSATLAGALRLLVDGREVQLTYTPELEPGAMRVMCRTPFTWTLRRVVLEGRPLPASIEALRATVIARDLVRLGL
jgi:hypothetical protein